MEMTTDVSVQVDEVVYPDWIKRLALIEMPQRGAGATALPATLHLHRLAPHTPTHFSLHYHDEQGRSVAGQWLQAAAEFERIVKATRSPGVAPRGAVQPLPALGVLLQLNGADRKLTGLAPLVAQPGATLLVHHPERRAVVRVQEETTLCYGKVVRPSRAADLAVTMRTLHGMAEGCFDTPRVVATDLAQGVLHLSALPGGALYDQLHQPTGPFAAARAGAVLRALHELPAPSLALPHTAADEVQVLQRWLARLTIVAPALTPCVATLIERVATALTATASPPVLLHRDFYDKQVFVTDDGQAGLLDFDTLAVGEAALDLANGLVHFELRALQKRCTWAQATAAAAALLAAYQPSHQTEQRLAAYADATRLRLACVYACRPTGITLIAPLLAAIGRPLLA